MRKLGLGIIAICLSIVSIAQEYEYRVMISSGNNLKRLQSERDWSELRLGAQMGDADSLLVNENGYIVLIHNSGAHVEMRDPGKYSLSNQGVEEDESLGSKYIGYVLGKMTPEEKESNRKAYASITGATKRGFNEINVFMDQSSVLFNSDVALRWDSVPGSSFTLTFMNRFDDVIKKVDLDKNYTIVDMSGEEFNDHNLVILKVETSSGKKRASETYKIQRLAKNELGAYQNEHTDLLSNLQKDSPMSQLILAEFYEQHKLLLDAATSYEKAMSYSPNVEYFKEAYKEFLMRNGWSDSL